MQHMTIKGDIRDLHGGQWVKNLNRTLDKGLHEVVVDVGHHFLAKKETDSDEILIKVRLLHILFDVFDHLLEDWELSNTHGITPTWSFGIQNNHKGCHKHDIVCVLRGPVPPTIKEVNQLLYGGNPFMLI